jgi:hypothetical protein
VAARGDLSGLLRSRGEHGVHAPEHRVHAGEEVVAEVAHELVEGKSLQRPGPEVAGCLQRREREVVYRIQGRRGRGTRREARSVGTAAVSRRGGLLRVRGALLPWWVERRDAGVRRLR